MSRPWTVALALAAGLAALGGVALLGKLARDDLDRRGYYTLVIADLNVPAPPGMTRQAFLDEICYESRLPETLDRTDPAAPKRLQAAIAAHPWVESAAVGDLAMPDAVRLTFRRPTLVADGRVVDRLGVKLPLRTPADGLPTFRGAPESLAAVAKTLDWLRGRAPEIHWRSAELTADGLVLERSDGSRAVWGFSTRTEPPAEEKLARLKDWKTGAIDLRRKE